MTRSVILSREDGEGSPARRKRILRSFPFASLRVRMTGTGAHQEWI
jgi:hypothetical protein